MQAKRRKEELTEDGEKSIGFFHPQRGNFYEKSFESVIRKIGLEVERWR
jgi:hypothetical protein